MSKQDEYYMCQDQGENQPMSYQFFLVAPDEEPHPLAMPSGAVFEDGEQVAPRKEYLKGK